MGIMDRVKSEFIDIIDWTQTERGSLVHKFQRHDNEIKNGAKLTVREGQAAVFVNEGKIADIFSPGMYTLTTENLPVLATLKGWKYGFHSPFKADVFFINMAAQPDQKWGTPNPIMMRDKDFGIVRVRGFGSYVFRIIDPSRFIRELVAAHPSFETFEIDGQLRDIIVARFSDVLGKSGLSALDLVGNYEKLAALVHQSLKAELESWGLDVSKFFIENLSLPPEVEQAIDRRSAMGAIGDLNKYTQFQAAEALQTAAASPGGAGSPMSAGLGMGAGLAMGQQMATAFGQPQSGAANANPPPPLPGTPAFHVAIAGQPQGPFDMAAIQQLVANGKLSGETLVWRAGLSGWIKARDAAELSTCLAAIPPPLPKP